MGSEPKHAPTCRECGGMPDACICDALAELLATAPDPPETPKGSDWSAWLQTAVRESNDGHPRAEP